MIAETPARASLEDDLYGLTIAGQNGLPLRPLHGHGLVGCGERKRMTAREINAGIGANVLRERF